MFHRLVPMAALSLLAMLTAPASGQNADALPPNLISSSLLHGKLELSLKDAVEMGLENNLRVEVQRHAPLIAERDEKIAWGAYDPEAYAEFGYSDTREATGNTLLGNRINVNKGVKGFGGLRGLVPMLGSEYKLQFDGDRRTTNSAVQNLSAEFSSSISLDFTQPFLKDLIWNQEWTRVKVTSLAHQASLQTFRRDVMDAVRSIEDGYWGLIAAKEFDRVAQKSLDTASALLEQVKTQYEVGVVSKVAVTEAVAGEAQREVELIRADNAYRNAQDTLIDLVLGPGLRAESSLEIQPTDDPDDYIFYEINVEEAVRTAFRFRPELAAKQHEIEQLAVDVKFAKNQRLPELDAVLSFNRNGISGENNSDCRFGCETEKIDKGFDNTFRAYDNTNSYSAGARFSMPIMNTAARNQVSKDELELRQALTERRRIEQDIILDVRIRARNLKSSQEGIEAAERARAAADEQLRAERIRLEYGESTPFDVLQREEALVRAESDEIDAVRAYRISATDLDRAQGTILRNRNIMIDQVRALR